MNTRGANTEEYQFSGDELVDRIKELVHEGNIRRIIIKNEEGRALLEIPLTLGVVGAALLPVWAAIGATVLQVLAMALHASRQEFGMLPINATMIALQLFVAWGRIKKAPIAPRP